MSYNFGDENSLRTILSDKGIVKIWYPKLDIDEIMAMCNAHYGQERRPTLVIVSSDQIKIKNKKVILNDEQLFKDPYKIEFYKVRLNYRNGREAELVAAVEQDLGQYKSILNQLVKGMEYVSNNWDAERVQGFLYVCGYQFDEVLSKRLTNVAYVTLPFSAVAFLVLPVEGKVFHRFFIELSIIDSSIKGNFEKY